MRKIQLRIRELDSAPNNEDLCDSKRHCSVHQCLSKIVTKMVSIGTCYSLACFLCNVLANIIPSCLMWQVILLNVKSEFVQHVAVNALVLTSQFVSSTVWNSSFLDEFRLRLIYDSLKWFAGE